MSSELDPIGGMQATIRQWELDLVMLKQSANLMCARLGKPPLYAEAELSTGAATIGAMKSDQFYGKGIGPAMREYLSIRKASNLGPATVNEIYAALVAGQCKFETDDVENRKRGMRVSLTKNTTIFHRMPDGTSFGLKEWYPGVKDEDQQPKGKGKKRGRRKKVKKKSAGGTGAEPEKAKSPSGKVVSLLEAVRLAIEATTGDFTKPDILAWIQKRHPELKAGDRKDSVFTTVNKLKDELGIETVKEGKGAEPFVFRRKKG